MVKTVFKSLNPLCYTHNMIETRNQPLVGQSEYSEVREYVELDVHGSTIDHGKKNGLVAKEAKGIGKYFTPTELRINKRLQTVVDTTGGKQFIVDFIKESEDGRLVFERLLGNLEDVPTLDPKSLGEMIASVTSGALFLDKMRISHRDLHRIQNVFVSENGEYKIGDFNLSEFVGANSETGNLKALCTMVRIYVAERILGQKDVIDNLVDVTQILRESSAISTKIKAILLRFLESNDSSLNRLRTLATELIDSNEATWL